jgi:uncharacterized protein YaiI (UPF0178 family)
LDPPAARRLWIDGDACPRAVRDRAATMGQRRGLEPVFVANQAPAGDAPAGLRHVRVENVPEAADEYIIAHCAPGDLVVSDDATLAAEACARGALTVTLRGKVLDAASAADRRATRDLLVGLRDAGQPMSGPAPWGADDLRRFAQALGQALDRSANEQK